MNAKIETTDACDLRFGQVGIACVRVRRVDAAALCDELERRVRAAPQMFARAAVVLDLSHLLDLPDDGAVDALLEAVRSAGMLPVGLAYGTSETEALAKRMGLPLIAKFRAAYEPVNSSSTAAEPARQAEPATPSVQREPILSAPAPGSMQGAQHHAGSVRSGQQVYARDRDLIVTGAIANGAEVIADGNIHVYGPLRGRAIAGAAGDTNARIFCQSLDAELLSIAGYYCVSEAIEAKFLKQRVQISLAGEQLVFERLP
jgi:septum site-determining protein MinC